jgi:hypothetical protein
MLRSFLAAEGGDNVDEVERERRLSMVSDTCDILCVPEEDEEAVDIPVELLCFSICLTTFSHINLLLFLLFRH